MVGYELVDPDTSAPLGHNDADSVFKQYIDNVNESQRIIRALMSVTEKLMAPGVFNVTLDLSLVPNSILTSIQPYDQIIITNNPMETQDYIDSVMLPTAEYIGVITSLKE